MRTTPADATTSAQPHELRPSTTQVVAAFTAVYLLWGSTFLAIRFAIETMPPFAMAGLRFVIAGGALYAWVRLRGAARPRLSHWGAAAVVGALLLVCGNGAVVWAEQRVASGVASLLIAMVPLWMVLLDWLRPGGTRPGGWVLAGVAMGFVGIALLVGPGSFGGSDAIDHLGAAVLLVGSLSWAAGSLYSRRATLPSSPLLGTGMELLCGGVLMLIIAAFRGGLGSLATHPVSLKSAGALLYLVIFGSLVGFTCYLWLLRVSTPARVSTYAYVNPVVAVILGWAFAGEPLTARTLLAASVIVGAVVVITIGQGPLGAARGMRGIGWWRDWIASSAREVEADLSVPRLGLADGRDAHPFPVRPAPEAREEPLLPLVQDLVHGGDHDERQDGGGDDAPDHGAS